jgi:hypothetical protein
MARRALPPLLALGGLVADAGGRHGYALALLLVSIPAAFSLALDWYGEALEGRCGGSRPILGAVAVLLLVFSAALRSPAVVGGVPHLSISAMAGALLLYVAVCVGVLMQSARPVHDAA